MNEKQDKDDGDEDNQDKNDDIKSVAERCIYKNKICSCFQISDTVIEAKYKRFLKLSAEY